MERIVFHWDANEDHNALAMSFMSLGDAWDHFRTLMVTEFPDFILEFSDRDVTATITDWSDFVARNRSR